MKLRMHLPLLIATALLASCATSQSNALPGATMPRALHSWTAPQTSSVPLLYVSNADNEVTVYDYTNQNLVGVLTGFQRPMGLCTDLKGDVYITDALTETIVEYAHAGTKPIKTLDDSPDHPSACSVSPTTGDLAVADNNGTSTQGDLAIWTHATGKPIRYTNSTLYRVTGCVYDPHGNLLVGGVAEGAYTASFAWMAHGISKLTKLFVPGPDTKYDIYSSGVGWDGRYFTIDDYEILRILVTHGQAYYAGRVALTYGDGHANGPFAFYYQAGMATMVIAGVTADTYGDQVDIWNYPAGGDVTLRITHGVDAPYAVVISPAQ